MLNNRKTIYSLSIEKRGSILEDCSRFGALVVAFLDEPFGQDSANVESGKVENFLEDKEPVFDT